VFLEELLYVYACYVFIFHFLPAYHFEKYDTVHIILGSIFVMLVGICQVCFVVVSNTDPGHIDEKFLQTYAQTDRTFASLTTERKHNGEMRTCNKCRFPKPDRAHHCSICNQCILRMDHHCPFVNNCIGFFNYKYFLVFIFWTLCFCFFMIACMIYDNYDSYENHSKKINYFEVVAGFLCVVAAFFLAILFSNHVKFVFRNLTTIEHVEKKASAQKHPYNLGWRRNFVDVFGTNPLLWLLPVWTTQGDGITFNLQAETSSLLIHT